MKGRDSGEGQMSGIVSGTTTSYLCNLGPVPSSVNDEYEKYPYYRAVPLKVFIQV